jgi:hypothetical protein
MFSQGELPIIIKRGFIMTATRQQLRDIIEVVDSTEIGVLYQLLVKFIPETMPMSDEIEAIRLGRDEIRRGETVSHDEIDWT